MPKHVVFKKKYPGNNPGLFRMEMIIFKDLKNF